MGRKSDLSLEKSKQPQRSLRKEEERGKASHCSTRIERKRKKKGRKKRGKGSFPPLLRGGGMDPGKGKSLVQLVWKKARRGKGKGEKINLFHKGEQIVQRESVFRSAQEEEGRSSRKKEKITMWKRGQLSEKSTTTAKRCNEG